MAKSSSAKPTGRPAGKTAGKTAGKASGKASKRRTPPVVTATRPKPWGLIAGAVAVVVFAVAVIGYAVNKNIKAGPKDPAKLAAAAAKIPGIDVENFPSGQHDANPIKYQSLPPFGGTHNPTWADCTGAVYDKPIADENAVHALEHGSVWITYQPNLPKDQVDTLKKLVDGKDYMLMSPYPGLKKPVSLQSWGHQLFLDSANDKRVKEFITDLRQNPQTTPEYGANCVNPDFKANPLPPDQDKATDPAQGPVPASGAPAPSGAAPSGAPAPSGAAPSGAAPSPSGSAP